MRKIEPNKYACYFCFLIPLLINAILSYSSNEDIWYIMRYGKIILQDGFIHTDVLSIHSGLHIVIQQGFSNVIFYLIYHYLGDFGLFLLCEMMIGLYLFIIYKMCMLLSEKKILLSVLITTITCTLLVIIFMTPRPQIFTYFHLLSVMYIMEKFYKDNKTRLIYLLPLISLVQINLHASLWYYLFLFMLPYIVQSIIQRNKKIVRIIIVMIVMFLVGFINPYTYENVFFPFTTYDSYINNYILELFPVHILSSNESLETISIVFYVTLAAQLIIYIYYKKGKLELRHLFLLGGTVILAVAHVRNIAIFIIGSLPLLANYLKKVNWNVRDEYVDTRKQWIAVAVVILIVSILNTNRLVSDVYKGGEFLKNNYNTEDLVIYTGFDYGSYIEYLGFHSYFDTRAEVFLKKANKKENIFPEAVKIQESCNRYQDFIKKYQFTHMIVRKKSCLCRNLKKDHVKIVFQDEDFVIFEL